jgi:hypothetical protein
MITTKFQIFKEIFDPASREKIAKFAFFFLFSPVLEMLYIVASQQQAAAIQILQLS